MTDWRGDLHKAQEEARRAREEAGRLRDEARNLARRLRDEARSRAREERFADHGRSRHQWSTRPGSPPDQGDPPDGMRSERGFSLDGVTSLVIDQTAGKLNIRPCTGDETPGAVTSGSKSPPRLEVRRDGDRLIVEVHMAQGWLFRRRQGATTVVRVVPGLATLRAKVGYGDIQLRELACQSFDLDAGAGTIACYSTRGALRANMGAGRIALHDHAGNANCDIGTGDLFMDICEAPPGDYRANTGVGRAELRLPPGERVHVRASSGIGRTRIDYPDAGDDAPIQARVDTGVGEVVVRAREAGQAPTQPPVAARPQRPGRAPVRRREAEELRVLQLLEQGRITSQEAADLIAALQGAAPPPAEDAAPEEEPQPEAQGPEPR